MPSLDIVIPYDLEPKQLLAPKKYYLKKYINISENLLYGMRKYYL